MTRLRRARLAGALVALGIVFSPPWRGPSFSVLFLYCRSFRPRALISPANAEQVERRRGGKLGKERRMTNDFQLSEKARDLRPPVIDIGVLRLFGELLYLFDRNLFARLLRQLGCGRGQRLRHEGVDFVRVEPDEVTTLANIDLDRGGVGKGDLCHERSARGTGTTGGALAADGMQPQGIDRFGRESVPQKFERDGAAAAIVAGPEISADHLHLFQRQITARTNEVGTGGHG